MSGLGLTLALNLFILLLLIGLSRHVPVAPPPEGRMTVIGLSPTPERQSEQREEVKPRQVEQRRARPRLEKPEIVLPVKPTIAPPPLDLLELSKEELKTTDQALAAPQERSAASAGGGSDTPVVGRGPNGETLYAAQWLREPTNQEIGAYITRRNAAGYGMIMCKTMPGYRVGDCVGLGSVPASARLDRVLLDAAWQFKVRPPRRNGQPMIGEWVRIRFDYVARNP